MYFSGSIVLLSLCFFGSFCIVIFCCFLCCSWFSSLSFNGFKGFEGVVSSNEVHMEKRCFQYSEVILDSYMTKRLVFKINSCYKLLI